MIFADDTNLTAVECAIKEIKEDLLNISNWLNANKLVIIHEKIVQQKNIESSSLIKPWCFAENKSSYASHVDSVLQNLSKSCGTFRKLRHFVPREKLIDYYKSNISPIVPYDLLVYGVIEYSTLASILNIKNPKNYLL